MSFDRDDHRRLLLVGWDGATWDLLRPWMAAGHLPNLSRLVGEGASARLPSLPTMNSGPAWSSIITGVNPGRHGIFHLQNDPAADERRPMHGSDRRAPAVWSRLSAAGVPVGVVNVPVTYPAEAVHGVMISGSDAPSPESPGMAYPSGLMSEIVRRVGPYELGPDLDSPARAGRLDALRDRILDALDRRLATVLYLMRTRPWRFFMVVFTESDWAQHYLWPPDGLGTTSARLRRVFERLDDGLAALREVAGSRTTLMLVSDHGFGHGHAGLPYLIPLLAKLGYLRRAGAARQRLLRLAATAAARLPARPMHDRLERRLPGIYGAVRSELRRPPIEWGQTRAYAPVTTAELYINLKGRQRRGIVEPEAYEPLRDELARALGRVAEARSGRPAIKAIWRCQDVYRGPETVNGPDLIVEFDCERPYHGLTTGGVTVLEAEASPFTHIAGEPMQGIVGGHRKDGILAAVGPEIRRGAEVDEAALYDIAPTVLHLLGQTVPEGLDGRVNTQLFTREALATQPVRSGPDTLAASGPHPPGLDAAGEAAVLDRLRRLGYSE